VPHLVLLGQVDFALMHWAQPEACLVALRMVAQLLAQLVALVPLLFVVFASLFCVTVLSGDIAYLLVRLEVHELDVWAEHARPRWALAWAVTWLMQMPLWLRVLPSISPLLTHELVNLVLTLHHLVLRFAGQAAPAFPSATLVASTEGEQRTSVGSLVALRTVLPLLYVLTRGIPAEWRQVLCLFLLDVLPTLASALLGQLGFLGRRGECEQLPWELSYPPSRSHSCDEEECEVHGGCAICLSSLCRAGGASAAAASAAESLRRQLVPGLAVTRLCRGSASISAARIPADWGGGRIATTRCGHRFHSQCLTLAAESLLRCPHCRSGLMRPSQLGAEIPDEETLDSQMLCLAFGLLLGAILLFIHWTFWKLQTWLAEPENMALAEEFLRTFFGVELPKIAQLGRRNASGHTSAAK